MAIHLVSVCDTCGETNYSPRITESAMPIVQIMLQVSADAEIKCYKCQNRPTETTGKSVAFGTEVAKKHLAEMRTRGVEV